MRGCLLSASPQRSINDRVHANTTSSCSWLGRLDQGCRGFAIAALMEVSVRRGGNPGRRLRVALLYP
jgi:hypothetical protein